MKSRRSISVIMMFFFLTFSIMSGIGVDAFGEPTAPNQNIMNLTFVKAPYAEYVAGSKVSFKVVATATNGSKIQMAAKLYNLDSGTEIESIMKYGTAYNSNEQVSMLTTVSKPGNYRIAVFAKLNGTNGTITIGKNSYDVYKTSDFKISKPSVVGPSTTTVDLMKIYTEIGSAYKLPTKVNGKTPDGVVKQYSVTWDKVASTKKLGTFNFIGTLKQIGTSIAIKNVKANLTLIVHQMPTFATTSAAIDLYSDYKLPAKINGTIKGLTTREYGVAWDKPLKTTSPGAFYFNGTVKNLTTNLVLKNVKPRLVVVVNKLPVFSPIVEAVDERSNYKLPENIIGKLPNGKEKKFLVIWDKAATTDKAGTTTYVGVVAYPDTLVKLKNVKVILTLTVREVPVFEQINAIATEGVPYTLPDIITGKLSNGSTKSYQVTWNDKANTTQVGTFNFEGSVKDLTTGIVVPNVKATLKLTVNPLRAEAVVKAIDTKTFMITFNKKIESEKCKIAVSMNDIAITLGQNWQTDGKSVMLQSQNDLAVGKYVIKISGLDMAVDSFIVEVQKPVLTSITIPTVFVTPNNAAAKILIEGKDQYGQNIVVSAEDFNWTVNDITANKLLPVTATDRNYITVQTNLSDVKVGDKISLYCVYKTNSSVIKNANLEINSKAIDSLVLGQPVLSSNEKRLTQKSVATYYEIPYSAIQNFTVNGAITQANAIFDDKVESSLDQAVTLNNYYFIADKPDILTAVKVENGKLYVKVGAGKSGTVKLSATAVPENGQTTTSNVSSVTINIEPAPQATSITLGKADSVLSLGGTPVKVPVVVYDQYSEVIASDAFAKTNFTDFIIVSSNPSIATAAFDAEGKNLVITAVAVGSTNITIINRNSTKNEVYQAVVNAAAVVKDFKIRLDYSYLVKGAVASLMLDTYDQYGSKMKSVATTYKYALTTANGASFVKLSSTGITVNNAVSTPITITGITSGRTDIITATLYNDANNNNVIDTNEMVGKPFAFNINTIADNEVLTYSIDTINTPIYAAVSQDRSNSGLTSDAYGTVQNQNNKNLLYAKGISIKATTANGNPVALVGNPITAVNATVNGSAIDYAGKYGNDFIVVGCQWSGLELTKDVNLQITYVDNTNTTRNINTKITVSKESLVAKSIKFRVNSGKDNDATNDMDSALCTISLSEFNALNGKKLIENQTLTGIPAYFEVIDQYGVSSINAFNFTVTGKQSALGSFTFDNSGAITTSGFVAGDSITISASDTEGHIISGTIRIQ